MVNGLELMSNLKGKAPLDSSAGTPCPFKGHKRGSGKKIQFISQKSQQRVLAMREVVRCMKVTPSSTLQSRFKFDLLQRTSRTRKVDVQSTRQGRRQKDFVGCVGAMQYLYVPHERWMGHHRHS